jgi:hypothetical protein
MTVSSASYASTSSYSVSSSYSLSSSYSNTSTSASYAANSSRSISSSYSLTSSYAPGYLPLSGGTINGNVIVNGTASIAFLNVTFESASVIYSSGSNQFGDAANDVQTLYGAVNIPTGSLTVSGSTTITGSLTVTAGIFGTSSWSTNSISASYYRETDPIFTEKSASLATTGSNQFNGNQTITGSLIQGQEGNLASGDYSHAEGYYSTSSGIFSHAEGNSTEAIGEYSHAEGDNTQAKGDYSHAEGQETISSGSYSHAEGYLTIAIGQRSHAEGESTLALGYASHAEGFQTIASADYQHVQGKYNISSSVESAFIIGNGTDGNNRSNLIYAVGNEVQITGSLKVTAGITGSLFGTSSWSANAATASYYRETDPVFVAKSASLATTGSNIFIGNQIVTGSLFTTGSNTLIGSTTLTGSLNISGSTTQIGNNTLLGNTLLSGSIIISGSTTGVSVNIYGNTAFNGYAQFNPVTSNIDTSISASYIYVSGSTQDLYFSQNGSGYSNVTRLRWIEGNLYTGLLSGGIISASLGTNTYYVSSGSGIIVTLNAATASHDPYPTVQYLRWNSLSKTIDALSASFDQQFVAINSSNVIEAQGTPYTDGDYNTKIPIGIVLHQNHTNINAFQTFPSVAYGWKQRTFDFFKAFGPLKISGYALTPSGSSTGSLVLAGGTSWVDGRNYIVDPNTPSYINEAVGITTSKIYRYYQRATLNDWFYDTNGGAGYATIDPTQYSNGTTLVTLSTNNKWSIQRVYYFPNSATKAFYIYYGNAQYDTVSDAKNAITSEAFTEAPNTAANAILVAYLLLQKTANFTSAGTYEIVPAGLFRGGGGGGASSGGTTVPGGSNTQIQYNNNGAFGGVTNLTWDGTLLQATGSFTGSFIGSLQGTASFATTASYITASNVYGPYGANSIISASFAVSASWAPGGTGAGFPYVGNAQITGSLLVTGSTALNYTVTQTYKIDSTTADTTILATINTGSNTSAFTNYTINNGVNARAGQLMTVWNGTTTQYTDVSTLDIGDTSAIVFTSSIAGPNLLISEAGPAGWSVKMLVNLI